MRRAKSAASRQESGCGLFMCSETMHSDTKKQPFALAFAGMVLLLVSACGLRSASPEAFLAGRGIDTLQPLTVCTGFGCSRQGQARLSSQDLAGLDELFSPAAQTPAQERQFVARAVAFLESVVGGAVGTAGDLPRNQREMAASGQLDCIAEAANTTVYLLLFERRGLLAYHRVAAPEHRGGTVFTAHNTAVLREIGGEEFAVDSWFHANGCLPEVLSLAKWKNGFRPQAERSAAKAADTEASLEHDDGV